MKLHRLRPSRSAHAPQRGLALVVVMVLVLSMAVIAGAFAYAMKIETRLSVRTQSNGELEWLGRSGVEFARWVLDQERRIPLTGRIHSLNQFWAGRQCSSAWRVETRP